MKNLKNTNTNNYKVKLHSYLLKHIDIDGNATKKLTALFLDFDRVANHKYNLHRLPNDQERLMDYLQGLPSISMLPYAYNEILEFAKYVHETNVLTEKEENAIIQNFYSHVAFHLIKLAKKFDVKTSY